MEVVEHEVDGLEQNAEIVVDKWGIPHIRAETRSDIFFVQGFNAARDRLWQLDLWRKRGLGRLSSDFGPGFLLQDRAARLFLFRGDMSAEWKAYGIADAKEITEAFARGINAFIALARRQPKLLPPEFNAMAITPEPWTAEDVVRIRSHALVRNILSEASRTQVAARAGLRVDLARYKLSAPGQTGIPIGLDPDSIPLDLLDTFLLATARVEISPERLAAKLSDSARWAKVNELGDILQINEAQGSNNWAVGPHRTDSGRPIMASDPHRAHALPSLRYIVHLTGPGINVIGAGEPVIPGITFGHNDDAAFSMTFFPADQSDIFVYETDPSDPNRYRYQDDWESMKIEKEWIKVKGSPEQEITLKFTRHGPVIYEDATRNRAYAVRSVWFEPGASAYFANLSLLDKTTLGEFEQSLTHWSVPPGNWVYADTRGDIAWIVAGKVPRRPNWDGLLPVPGHGAYEWNGFHPPEDLPREHNPATGFVATANEMNLPEGFPNTDRKISFEWLESSRAVRIKEVLSSQQNHSVKQSLSLQTDDFSVPARRVLALLFPQKSEGTVRRALNLLEDWDCHLGRASAPAALFEVWWMKHLKPALLNQIAPDAVVRALISPGDNETILSMLEAGVGQELIPTTLERAFQECCELLGPNPATWEWGGLHHGFFGHALSSISNGPWRDVGPVPKGGSGSSPMSTTYRTTDFRITAGASFRMVVDVGNWDNSHTINAPGQSGDPRSVHYDDLAEKWASGEYVPLLFSRDAVDSAARQRIRLVPVKRH